MREYIYTVEDRDNNKGIRALNIREFGVWALSFPKPNPKWILWGEGKTVAQGFGGLSVGPRAAAGHLGFYAFSELVGFRVWGLGV